MEIYIVVDTWENMGDNSKVVCAYRNKDNADAFMNRLNERGGADHYHVEYCVVRD